jgi:hypothetical protein
MANKYLRHGETYCGDGTTSAAAASNGAVGAWNNINVLEGTAPAYGALAAGDTVFIRSKDNAGANITRTLAAGITLGSASATSTAWITWVLDAGTVWSTISGTLTYSCGSTYTVTLTDYNNYICDAQDALVILETNASANYKEYLLLKNCVLKNMLIDLSAANASGGAGISTSASVVSLLESVHIKFELQATYIFALKDNCRCTMIATDIELTGSAMSGIPLFQVAYSLSKLEIIGGQIRGAGANTAQVVFQAGSSDSVTAIGFQFPRSMTLMLASITDSFQSFNVLGLDGGAGAMINENWGYADTRDDNYYPKLNAFLPNSASTPWSWKIYPLAASLVKPLRLIVSKFYTASAATKTIGLEILLDTGATARNKLNTWIDVTYIDDTTGLAKHMSTQDVNASALDTSTAAWTATTYGAVGLSKKKFSVTTPTTIKQDSVVTVTYRSTAIALNSNDIQFICPDLTLT